MFDFYPSDRDVMVKTSMRWLDARRQDDCCEGFWRIHGRLYDLTNFVDRHPGGRDWLSMTKGTDITEAFESMHALGVDEKILKKYYVKDAQTERNYRFTFQKNGFYNVLKERAGKILKKTGTGPDWRSRIIQDTLTVGFLASFVLTCYLPSRLLILVTGLLLGMQTSSAHNWFHQSDSKGWRRYYFDLSFLSHKDWRVSHALSHHLYTNTYSDIEVTAVEPFLYFLPLKKNFILKMLAPVYFHLFTFLAFNIELLKRIVNVVTGQQELLWENLIPLAELMIHAHLSGDIWRSMQVLFLINGIASYWLIMTSVTTTHHHPDLYHAGDVPRVDPDWGLHQVDTVRDISKPWLPLVLTTFGDHLLHHLFPAVDHSKLPALYPVLYQTLEEFGVQYPSKTLPDMVKGLNIQIGKCEPTDRSNK